MQLPINIARYEMANNEIEYLSTTNLKFDSRNPRFYRLNEDSNSDERIVEEMIDDESVADLMRSIGQQGYFPGEPLLVVKEGDDYTVVEGNRRLAAVKLLTRELDPPEKKTRTVQDIIQSSTKIDTLSKLPCLIYEAREDVLRFIGYRHITGVKEWDALSKAKYLKEIKETFYAEDGLNDEIIFKKLAAEIGSRADYVALLLTSLSIYDKARDSEFYKLRMNDNDVEFSLITTALGYKDITTWLGLETKKDYNLVGLDEDNLKNLFKWMFVADEDGLTSLRDSRNLSKLADIVTSQSAINHLNKQKDIEQAFLYTEGPSKALSKILANCVTQLDDAWDLLKDISDHDVEQYETAQTIWERSKKIRNHIRDIFEEE
jgi:hypothetical protein